MLPHLQQPSLRASLGGPNMLPRNAWPPLHGALHFASIKSQLATPFSLSQCDIKLPHHATPHSQHRGWATVHLVGWCLHSRDAFVSKTPRNMNGLNFAHKVVLWLVQRQKSILLYSIATFEENCLKHMSTSYLHICIFVRFTYNEDSNVIMTCSDGWWFNN